MSIRWTFDIVCYYFHYFYYSPFTKKRFHIKNAKKTLIKVCEEREKPFIYINILYKSVNIYIKFYQNFENYHSGKLNKTYLMNEFCITLKDYFLEHKFLYLP